MTPLKNQQQNSLNVLPDDSSNKLSNSPSNQKSNELLFRIDSALLNVHAHIEISKQEIL
jgi:hypothetical protein